MSRGRKHCRGSLTSSPDRILTDAGSQAACSLRCPLHLQVPSGGVSSLPLLPQCVSLLFCHLTIQRLKGTRPGGACRRERTLSPKAQERSLSVPWALTGLPSTFKTDHYDFSQSQATSNLKMDFRLGVYPYQLV